MIIFLFYLHFCASFEWNNIVDHLFELQVCDGLSQVLIHTSIKGYLHVLLLVEGRAAADVGIQLQLKFEVFWVLLYAIAKHLPDSAGNLGSLNFIYIVIEHDYLVHDSSSFKDFPEPCLNHGETIFTIQRTVTLYISHPDNHRLEDFNIHWFVINYKNL